MTLRGAELASWARREAGKWWEARWDSSRQPLDELIAEAYVHGAIDALREETERLKKNREY